MSEATLYQHLKKQAARGAARFHMPGHKGRPVLRGLEHPFAIDYTEIIGTGSLYEGDEPILCAERDAARYYGASDCLFLTGGSTQALMTAIGAVVPPGGTLVVDRNCHKAVTHAMALLDLTPVFIIPEALGEELPGLLDPRQAHAALARTPHAAAMLITSPNYYGVLQDIPALAAVCRSAGVPLLVDAAHGAHLKAAGLPSPIEQGADLAAISTHKTLPALGQSALLLSSGRIPFGTLLETAPLFGTSSPSYVLLASIDLARAWLEGAGAAAYAHCVRRVAALRREICRTTVFSALTDACAPLDPCRLTVCCRGTNVTGHQLNRILHERFDIDAEMADLSHVVFICTGADTARDDARLMGALRDRRFYKVSDIPSPKPLPFPTPQRVCSVRKAWFFAHREIPLAQAAGCICARPLTPYPPGVPLVYPGERIGQVHIEFLRSGWYTDTATICVMDDSLDSKGEVGAAHDTV